MSPVAPVVPRTPRAVLVGAWAVPVLVLTQFSMLAVVPVALVLATTLRRPSLRWLRPYGVALAATYAAPLVIWIVRPNGAPSLSQDMHPGFVVLVVAASAVLLAKIYTRTTTPEDS